MGDSEVEEPRLRGLRRSRGRSARMPRPFQKREESRDGVISEVEALQLRPLPSVRYDVAQWACDRAVNLDFRVVHAKNRYSVPLQLDPAFAGSFLSLLS